ncbi:MAG: hom [Firmicutes bacterium]|nr:hom [Bacillota bacterium]
MEKTVINVGLLGMGTVGTGVAKLITSNKNNYKQKIGAELVIKTILVRNPNKIRQVAVDAAITTDIKQIVNDPSIDIVVEVMGGENPAKDYMLAALKAGKHVVTANKDVMSKYGRELFEAAEENSVDLLFEASVAGGIPIIRPLKQCLTANNITEVMGIINGTTNFMLTKMTVEGLDYDSVLAEAQRLGYAEADPTADVGGLDAARKIAILASIAFGSRVTFDNVHIEGITGVTPEDICYAGELGYIIKLLAIAKDSENGIDVRVHPTLIPVSHPLSSVNNEFNAIFVRGDAVGETMFYGRGAGELPTASAVVADVIDVARDMKNNVSSRILCTCFDSRPFCPIDQTQDSYYIRILVDDQPGALAAIAGAFGSQGVSLHSVIQKSQVGKFAELVLITYDVTYSYLKQALDILRGMSVVHKINSVIRVIKE